VIWRIRFSFHNLQLNSSHYSSNYFRNKSFGDVSYGGTPGNISNPVVKAVSADGTWGVTPWESRLLPKDFFNLKH
jgi:hypothetical protein